MKNPDRNTPPPSPIVSAYWLREQIAWFFGVGEEAVRKWDREGCPKVHEGNRALYPIFKVIGWYNHYKASRKTPAEKKEAKRDAVRQVIVEEDNGGLPSLELSERRQAFLKAEHLALNLSKARKEVLSIDLMQSLVASQFSMTRTSFMSIATRNRAKHGDVVYYDLVKDRNIILRDLAFKLERLDLKQIINEDVEFSEADDVTESSTKKRGRHKKNV